MKPLSRRTLAALVGGASLLALPLGLSLHAEEPAKDTQAKIDPTSGMIIDEHWQTVQAMCSSCHSPKLFTNYGATRETWADLIDWMQQKQGLWEIPPAIESNILDYLAKNYPPGEASRRHPLPANLRPPNPYLSEAKATYEQKLKDGEIVPPKFEKK